jgi:hypothetical protein
MATPHGSASPAEEPPNSRPALRVGKATFLKLAGGRPAESRAARGLLKSGYNAK